MNFQKNLRHLFNLKYLFVSRRHRLFWWFTILCGCLSSQRALEILHIIEANNPMSSAKKSRWHFPSIFFFFWKYFFCDVFSAILTFVAIKYAYDYDRDISENIWDMFLNIFNKLFWRKINFLRIIMFSNQTLHISSAGSPSGYSSFKIHTNIAQVGH